MIEIEKYPCNDANEATARERYWFEELSANMNTNYPQRDQKEWTKDNREHLAEYHKTYNAINKDHIKAKQKEYNQNNKEHISAVGKIYRNNNKNQINTYQKEYRETNANIIKEKKQQYYEANRDKILERMKKKVNCICGSQYAKGHASKHLKTQNHCQFIANNPTTLENVEILK
jgi:hypothetical protein